MKPTVIATESKAWNGAAWTHEFTQAASYPGMTWGRALPLACQDARVRGEQVYLVAGYGTDDERWQAV